MHNNIIMIASSECHFEMTEKQILQLLKIQELFHSHYMTQQLLNDLVSLYVRLVEQISQNKHPLKVYFMQKMKFVLSRTEIIRILEKEPTSANQNLRETIKGAQEISQQDQMILKQLAEEVKEEVRQNHLINLKKDRMYENSALGQEMKNKERNMKIQMQLQFKEQFQENIKQLTQEMKDDQLRRAKEEQKIQSLVNKQDQALNQRRANRKKKLRKKSVNLNQKEVETVEEAPVINKAELLAVHKQLNQTYERFTRLTQNKTRLGTQNGRNKQNEGRVKMKIQENPVEEEDIFQQLQKQEKNKQRPPRFDKKAGKVQISNSIPEQLIQNLREVTSIQYKPLDQKQGRVTGRRIQYEEIEEQII